MELIPDDLGVFIIKYTHEEIEKMDIKYCDGKPEGSLHIRPAYFQYNGVYLCFECTDERVFGYIKPN
jgi:hypothetical protein